MTNKGAKMAKQFLDEETQGWVWGKKIRHTPVVTCWKKINFLDEKKKFDEIYGHHFLFWISIIFLP